jgi:4-amino-4-deoxy-L-arabinose transferase-like glycosyltransferase
VSVYWVLGAGFLLAGLFLPREWYDHLPKPTDLSVGEAPINGVTLFQICLIVDAAIMFCLAAWRTTRPSSTHEGWLPPPARDADDTLDARIAGWGLVVVTALGLFVRLYRVNTDLWLDEVAPVVLYGPMSAFHIATSYVASSNHLLNTLLVKASVAMFGEREWAIRLPAILFGTATVPTLYWVARIALTRAASLAVALLLAISYHHVFFSQNARGWSPYLLFSLLSTGLLIHALRDDRPRTWILYAVTMTLNFASNLLGFIVFGGHVIAVAGLVALRYRAGRPVLALARRYFAVAAITGLIGCHLYAIIVPQVYVYVRAEYVKKSSGFEFFSLEHVAEWVRGVSAGFGAAGILAMLPFLAFVLIGFVELMRRHAFLALTLALPSALTATGLLANRLQFSPRFFLLGIPLAFLAVVCAIEWIAARAGRVLHVRPATLSTVALAALYLASAAGLASYYRYPKQDYRGPIRYIEQRRAPGEIVLAFFLADTGYSFYASRIGLVPGKDFFRVRSVEALDDVLRTHPGTRTWAFTTFPRNLRITQPELFAKLEQGWVPERRFPGTVGDGEVTVWVSR